MDCWGVLGIPNTISVEQLQITYYNKLRQYSSTGNEDKCSELKKAYEEALDSIKNNQGERAITGFIKDVDDMYNNFAERIKLESWINVINKYNTGSETVAQLNEELLKYLQTHQNLPHKVWQYLDGMFKWTYYKNELYIKFPKDYIDFILKYAKQELYIRYDKFDLSNTKIDYDTFINEIIKTTQALAKREVNLVQEHINKAKNIYSTHIDLKILFIKYKKLKNELDRCIELCNFMLYIGDKNKIVYSIRGDCYLKKNDLESAYNDFKLAMELEPRSNEDYYNMAFVCFLLRKPMDAKKYIECIKEDDLYLTLKKDLSKDINNLIRDMELPKIIERINAEPMNLELYKKAFEIYYNIGDYYEIYTLLNNLNALGILDVDLHLKLGKVCLKLDKLDEALLALYNVSNEDSENFEALSLIGDVLVKLSKDDEALVMYNKALALKANNKEILMKLAEVLFKLGKYKESMEYCNILDRVNKENNTTNSEKLDNLIILLLIELKSYEAALTKCEIILNINPNSVDICLSKIKIYNSLGKYDEVLELLNSMPEINSKNFRFLNEKAQTLYYLGEINEAEKICKDLINEKHSSYEPEFILGLIYSSKKNYKMAAQYYDLALKKANAKDNLLLAIGINHKNLGDDEKALEYINKAIELNYVNMEAYAERIDLYMKKKQYEEALIDAEKCLEVKETPLMYFKLGEIMENLNKNPMSCYNKAILLDENYIDAHLNRGIYHAKVGKHNNAFEDFNKVISIDKTLPLPYLQRGNMYLKSGKSSEAIEEYNKAVDLGYDEFDVYMKLGDCYRAINNYDNSIKYCNYAIERNPGIVDVFRTRGLSLYNISDFKGALSDFDVCIGSPQLDKSEEADIYKYIAYCYIQLNDSVKAEKYFKEAINLDPNNIHLKDEYEQFSKQNSGISKLKSVFFRKK